MSDKALYVLAGYDEEQNYIWQIFKTNYMNMVLQAPIPKISHNI